MLNGVWVGMVLIALVVGAVSGKLDAVATAITVSANSAVSLAIGLVGMMALFLGLMRVLQEGGALRTLARWMRPLMQRLFPDIPPEHPAMSMMILNFTANMLGLANAATPFGLKAMTELDKLNPHKGTASDAMILFLAINTSNLAIFPTGMIGLRAGLGSTAPASIFATTLLATLCSTIVAIVATKIFIALRASPVREPAGVVTVAASSTSTEIEAQVAAAVASVEREPPPASAGRRAFGWALAVGLAGLLVWATFRLAASVGWFDAVKQALSQWMLVVLVAGFVLYGVIRGVKVYDQVVEGGKEGFAVALKIIPFLVAILVAVGMFRSSGALEILIRWLEPFMSAIGIPAETLPMALLRPLSGSGAYGVAAELMKTYGPDSLIGNIVATMQGSSETTFYVIAVYFGAVQVRHIRFTLGPCLIAEATGMVASVWAVRLILF